MARKRSTTPRKPKAGRENDTTLVSTKRRRSQSAEQREGNLKEKDAAPVSPTRKRSQSISKDESEKIAFVSQEGKVSTHSTLADKPGSADVDLLVHRLRYLRFSPSAIICIRPYTQKTDTMVAISRQDGSVELRSVRQKFRTLATIAGWSSHAVHAMAWTPKGDLVGVSDDGSVFLVDFEKSKFRNVTASGGGQVHALVTLSHKKSIRGCDNLVSAACDDGSIRFFEVDSEDKHRVFPVLSKIPSTGSPVLSLAWSQNKLASDEKGVNPLSGSILFAGVADGTIRRFEHNGNGWRSVLRMTVECLGRSTPTKVWALASLSDGTIISADSLGHVQFWDGETGTLEASFNQNENKSDVLALDVTRDENKVFASGIDSRVISIERGSSDSQKWIMASAQRPHTHDVQAVAVCYRNKRKSSGASEILCTGGVDTKLCTYIVNDFQRPRPSTIFPWPSHSPISIASQRRVLSMKHKNRVEFFVLESLQAADISSPVQYDESRCKIGTLHVETSFNLSAVALCPNGTAVAVATSSTVLLFRLTYSIGKRDLPASVQPTRIPLDLPSRAPVAALKFIRDDRLILVTVDDEVYDISIEIENEESKAEVKETMALERFASNSMDLPFETIEVSPDGRFFALKSERNEEGAIQVFQEKDGAYSHWWSLPHFASNTTAMAFLRSSEPQLIVASLQFFPTIFDLAARSISRWSEGALGNKLNGPLFNRSDFPVRIGTNPSNPDHFFLGSFGAMVAFDKSRTFPTEFRHFPDSHVRSKRRKRSVSAASDTLMDGEQSHCTLCFNYNGMLYMDCIGSGELVVVEQPWLDVVSAFPEALHRKIYGS